MKKQKPRKPAKQKTIPLKPAWPPKCMTLPDTVEAIEAGVSPKLQRERERVYARRWPDLHLLPIGAALVVVNTTANARLPNRGGRGAGREQPSGRSV